MEDRVPLHGPPPRLSDQADQLVDRQELGGLRSRVVGDLLLGDRPVEVVGPEAERDLGQGNAAPRNVLADQAPAGGNGGGG